MARKISLEIEAVNNAQKAVSAALKQVKALTKAVKQNQKATDKTTSKTREEIAARKKLAKAIRDQRIDKELAQLEKKAVLIGLVSGAISKQGREAEKAAAKEKKLVQAQINEAFKQRAAQLKKTQEATNKATRDRLASAKKAEKELAAARKSAEADAQKAMDRMAKAQDQAALRKRASIEKAAKAAQKRSADEVKLEQQVRAARAKGFAEAEKTLAKQKKLDMDKFMAAKKLEDKTANARVAAARRAGKEAAKQINKEIAASKRSAVVRAKEEQRAAAKILAARVKASEKSRKAAEKSTQREIALSTKLAEKKVRDSVRAAKSAERAYGRDLKAAKRKNEKILRDIKKRREANALMQLDIARKAKKAAEQERKEIAKTEKAAVKANKNKQLTFAKVGKAAMRLFFIYETLRRAVQAVGAVFRNLFAEPIKSFAEFEKGLAEVATLLGKDVKQGADLVPKLTDKVKDLSLQFGKAPVDMAKALYFAVSSGATTAADAQEVLRVSTMLSTAGLIDAETSTRALVTVMNAYGIEFTKAEAVSDLFFVTVQKGITTVGELANKIGRVAGIAASAGVDIQTMFAFIAAGTKVTGLTTATVTGLRSTVQLLLKPGKEAREVFKRLNIEFGATAIRGRGLEKFITILRNRYRGLSNDGLTPTSKALRVTSEDLVKMLPNLRAQAVVLGLVTSKTNLFKENLDLMKDATRTSGATADAVNKIMQTFAFRMERAKSAVEVLKIEFGDMLTGNLQLGSFLDGVTTALTGVINAFRKFGKADLTSNMRETMKSLGKEFTFFAVDILGTVTQAMFDLVKSFAAIGFSVQKLRSILPASAGPVDESDAFQQLGTLQRLSPSLQTGFGSFQKDITLGEMGTGLEERKFRFRIGTMLTDPEHLKNFITQVEKVLKKQKELEEMAREAGDPQMTVRQAGRTKQYETALAALNKRLDDVTGASSVQAKALKEARDFFMSAASASDTFADKLESVRKSMRDLVKDGATDEIKAKGLLGILDSILGDSPGGGGGGSGKKDNIVALANLRARALEFYSRRLATINDQQKALTIPQAGPREFGVVPKDKTIFFPEPEVEKEQQRQSLTKNLAKRMGATSKEELKVIREVVSAGNKLERARQKDVKRAEKEELARKKAFYMGDSAEAQAQRARDRKLASHNMEQALIDIESDLQNRHLTETQAENAKEEAKLKILAMFERERHSVIKSAMAETIKGFKTELEIRQDTYNGDIDAQVAATKEAAQLYAQQLVVIEQTAKSEVEIELRKEQAKLDIVKRFSKEGEVDRSKAAKRGLAVGQKTVNDAKRAAKQQLQEIEQTASSIASTVVGLGSSLIKDLLNDEMTASEALKKFGLSVAEMAATTLAEFLIREGIKQAMIASTMTAQNTAALNEINNSNMVTQTVIANTQKQLAARAGGAGLSGLGGGLSSFFGSANNILGMTFAVIGLIGMIASLVSVLGDDKPKFREATSMEEAAAREKRLGDRQGFSRGGLVTGGVPGRDSVRALLQPGEFVLPKPTVDAIRQGQPPATPGRYATGGMVTPSAGTQIVFAPRIETIALPTSVQNMRYFRDTVAKTQGRLTGLKG